MELVEQYKSIQKERQELLNKLVGLAQGTDLPDHDNANKDELEEAFDDNHRIVKYLRECVSALELRLP